MTICKQIRQFPPIDDVCAMSAFADSGHNARVAALRFPVMSSHRTGRVGSVANARSSSRRGDAFLTACALCAYASSR